MGTNSRAHKIKEKDTIRKEKKGGNEHDHMKRPNGYSENLGRRPVG